MSRLHFIPLLMLAASACGDTATSAYSPLVAEEDAFQVDGTVASRSLLIATDGRRYVLVGPQTVWLRDLIGAEIRLRGEPDVTSSIVLWIVEFRVLTVDGLPALDGTLHVRPDGAYAIRTLEGQVSPVPEIPGELRVHLGKRVWLTVKDGRFVRFGPLGE